jgi:DNA polymerase II small subunit/DNA polymerase delta subunit B
VGTGDVTTLSLEHEYEEAAAFLDEVSRCTEVTVIPGNHHDLHPTHRAWRVPHHFAPETVATLMARLGLEANARVRSTA